MKDLKKDIYTLSPYASGRKFTLSFGWHHMDQNNRIMCGGKTVTEEDVREWLALQDPESKYHVEYNLRVNFGTVTLRRKAEFIPRTPFKDVPEQASFFRQSSIDDCDFDASERWFRRPEDPTMAWKSRNWDHPVTISPDELVVVNR